MHLLYFLIFFRLLNKLNFMHALFPNKWKFKVACPDIAWSETQNVSFPCSIVEHPFCFWTRSRDRFWGSTDGVGWYGQAGLTTEKMFKKSKDKGCVVWCSGMIDTLCISPKQLNSCCPFFFFSVLSGALFVWVFVFIGLRATFSKGDVAFTIFFRGVGKNGFEGKLSFFVHLATGSDIRNKTERVDLMQISAEFCVPCLRTLTLKEVSRLFF